MVHYSACQDAIWGLDSLGQIFIRTLSSSCPTGMHWTKLDLSQLGMTFSVSRLSLKHTIFSRSIFQFIDIEYHVYWIKQYLLAGDCKISGTDVAFKECSVQPFPGDKKIPVCRVLGVCLVHLVLLSLKWLGLTRCCAGAPAALARLALVPQCSQSPLIQGTNISILWLNTFLAPAKEELCSKS